MANNLIQIKRSSTTAIPASLSQGELAYTSNGDVLYIGSPNGSIVAIGGAYNPGVLTANQALVANSTSYLDAIKVANATIQGLYANGATGTGGQVLISGGAGSNIYWQDSGALGVNVAAQYTWSNTQTFQNTITFSSVINGTANNANYLGTKSEGNLNVNSATNAGSANNASYLGGTQAAAYVTNTGNYTLSGNIEFAGTNTFFSTNLYANAQVVIKADGDLVIANGAGIQANGVWGSAGQVLTSDGSGGLYYGTAANANNASYLNNKTEGNLNVNSATNASTANNASYLGGVGASSYVNTSGNYTLTGNITLQGNLVANGIVANGSTGNAGQILTSNGTSVYWTSQTTVSNVAANTLQSNTVSITDTITVGNTTVNVYVNASSISIGNSSVNTTINSTAFSGSANNATYLGGNTVSDIRTYADNKAGNAYSNAMSDTLSRNGTYTGNNVFSGANTTFSGTNTNVTGYLTTANGQLANIKLRGAQLQGATSDRNVIDLNSSEKLVISGGGAGLDLRAANDGTSWFTLNLSGNTGALTPSANGTMDLGSTTNRFGKIWLAGSTIELGNSSISDTANGVTVSGGLQVTSNAVFGNVAVLGANIDATSALLRVRDATISGNLTINGTLTTVDTSNIKIKDSIIQLADNNTATDTLDIGWYGLAGNASSTWYSGMVRKHDAAGAGLTTPVFQLFASNAEPTGTVDQTAPGFSQGTLLSYLNSSGLYTNSSVTNITANSTVSVALVANSLTLTTALAATYGGTGQNTYSSGDLLVANTGNALSKLSLSSTAGYILQSNGTALVYASLDAGTF
jgi:hypothetical protein